VATLYITEFQTLEAAVASGRVVAPPYPVAEQTVSTAGSALSTAFSNVTRFVRLATDAGPCSFVIGSNVLAATATVTNQRLGPNAVEYRAVNPGDKLSVITNT
jgi:hypothetical protein